MNRRLLAVAAVTLALLGSTACSSAPSTPASAPPPASTSAPASSTASAASESPNAGQSLAEACIEPNAKAVEAAAELAKVGLALSASDGKDPKEMVAAVVAMGDYFAKLAKASTNADVEKALSGIASGYTKLGKALGKVLIDEDLTAAADVSTVMTDLQKALTDFQTLCTP